MVARIPQAHHSDALTLWNYHQLHHELRRCSVAIGLGSHDLGVAIHAADLYLRDLFPVLLFSGSNSPTTRDRFPQGEAYHYRKRAIELGVPAEAILIEPCATNTGQNIDFSRRLLEDQQIDVDSVLLISRPYQQRRAYATCKQIWPEVTVICTSQPGSLPDYVASIGDSRRVIDMLVGDTQRVMVYPRLGYAIHQDVPASVHRAFERLVGAGFTSRLMPNLDTQAGRAGPNKA